MNRRFFFWILTVAVCFAVQILLSPFLSIYGAFPNLLLLSTIFFAVNFGSLTGTLLGFAWGLFADATSTCIFGSQTFMFTFIGYIAGHLQRKIDEEKPVAQMGIVFMVSVFYILGLAFFEFFFMDSSERLKSGISVIQPLYSTLIAPLLFWILRQWNDLLFFRDA